MVLVIIWAWYFSSSDHIFSSPETSVKYTPAFSQNHSMRYLLYDYIQFKQTVCIQHFR